MIISTHQLRFADEVADRSSFSAAAPLSKRDLRTRFLQTRASDHGRFLSIMDADRPTARLHEAGRAPPCYDQVHPSTQNNLASATFSEAIA